MRPWPGWPLDHRRTRDAVTAERAFLLGLGGGCSAPIAAIGLVGDGGDIVLTGLVASPDGKASVRVEGRGRESLELGARLASEALDQGARRSSLSGHPLEGKRIAVTRQSSRGGKLAQAIAALGGIPIAFPTIEADRSGPFPEFEAALRDLGGYDFVVITSANAAQAFADASAGRSGHVSWKCVAIGRATAEALEERGIAVAAMPDQAVLESVAACMGEVRGKRVLVPGSDIARGVVGRDLGALGAIVDEVVSYRTVAARPEPAALAELERGVDAVLFTSPSTVRNFAAIVGGPGGIGDALVACIGPTTADAARELGFAVGVTAADHSAEGLLSALVEYWRNPMSPGNPMPVRPRRLRNGEGLRRMVRETRLSPDDFIYPLFVVHGEGIRREIASMPGVFQLSIDQLAREAEELASLGVPAVILFGIPAAKDAIGSENFASDGIVQQAIRELKRASPALVVATDVCLCEYTESGHCGLLNHGDHPGLPEGYVLNDETLPVLAKVAVSHAVSGADLVAPSGMIDGMVGAIRSALDDAGYAHLPILSYAVKYASGFYGPFRDAAEGAPTFGDRTSHQMDPANVREAVREARLDVAEGADMLMVKPALAYLDVIRQTRELFPELPVAAYNVSGEYAMVKAGARNGWIDEERVTLEILTGIKRAGADLIVTYHAKDAARWIR